MARLRWDGADEAYRKAVGKMLADARARKAKGKARSKRKQAKAGK